MTIAERGSLVLGDRYELLDLIASGGMGQVWRGRDLRLDRPVAVKVLRSEYADDPGFAARFRAEATHAAALNHPNIAAVHDYGETTVEGTGEHIAYLVMELVDGDPLSALLDQEGPLDPDTAMSVLRQAAAALAEAHRAGLVHRDVKPANILVRPDGRVKLTDFGIAWSAASVPLTQAGQVIGTPQYMSPEQASGEMPRPASDVYALGLVGYEALTGNPAFDGDNPVTIALKQVQQEPAPMSSDVPEDVRGLIGAALTKDPDDRIPDGTAFLAAIDEALEHHPTDDAPRTRVLPVAGPGTRSHGGVPAVPVAATPSSTVQAPAALPVAVAAGATPVGSRRSRVRTWLVVSTVLAVLLGAGVTGSVLGLFSGEGAPTGSAEAASTARGSIVLAAEDHVGRSADDVEADLRALGLAVERRDQVTSEQPPGAVVALDPVGTALSAGDVVRLDVAVAPPSGPSPEVADQGRASSGSGSGNRAAVDPAPPARQSAPGAGGAEAGTDGTVTGDDAAAGSAAAEETTTDPTAADPGTGTDEGTDEGTGTDAGADEGSGTGEDSGTGEGTGTDEGTAEEPTPTTPSEPGETTPTTPTTPTTSEEPATDTDDPAASSTASGTTAQADPTTAP